MRQRDGSSVIFLTEEPSSFLLKNERRNNSFECCEIQKAYSTKKKAN